MAQSTNFIGDSPFMPVFNNSGVDIPVGRIVIVDTTLVLGVTLPADGAAQTTYYPVGITTEILYAGTWGRLLTRPGAVPSVTAAAAIAAGASVTCNSGAGQKGKAITASAGAPSIGIAWGAAAGLDSEFKVLIDRSRNA